jgi:hypothetical protein
MGLSNDGIHDAADRRADKHQLRPESQKALEGFA